MVHDTKAGLRNVITAPIKEAIDKSRNHSGVVAISMTVS